MNSSNIDFSGNNTAISGDSGNRRRRRRGLAADPEILAAINAQVDAGQSSAPEVRRALVDEFGDDVPSVRTIRDLIKEIKEIRDLEPSEPWTLADANPDEIAAVAAVWAVALERNVRITKRTAKWIVRVRAAAPDLPPNHVWRIVGLYASDEDSATQGLRDVLDALLAFAPWRSEDHAERYFAAANSGRIPSSRLAWSLAKRSSPQEKGQYIPPKGSQAAAWLENNPARTIYMRGEAVHAHKEPRQKRRKRPAK